MTSIRSCFEYIISGNKEEGHAAAGKVRKVVYSHASGGIDDIRHFINNAPWQYSMLEEQWRKAYFVRAISVLYFLHDREDMPDFLFPWLCQLLEHSSGTIRYAAVRMFENELGPLTVHIRFPDKNYDLDPDHADRILYSLFCSLKLMLEFTWRPAYEKIEYIHLLPASPYKSVQMVISEMRDCCGDEYMDMMDRTIKKRLSVT